MEQAHFTKVRSTRNQITNLWVIIDLEKAKEVSII